MATNEYTQPYCNSCRSYVKPQVVSSTYISGGPQYIGSSVTFNKFCSVCGEQVFSQADRDQWQRQRDAEAHSKRLLGRTLLFIFVGIPLLLVVLWCGIAVVAVIAAEGYQGVTRMTSMNWADRRIMLFQIYAFGGFILGILLSIQYIVSLVRRVSRFPWSMSLGLGWIIAASGFALVWFNAKPNHLESPALTLAEYCLYVSPGLYWLSAMLFWSHRKR